MLSMGVVLLTVYENDSDDGIQQWLMMIMMTMMVLVMVVIMFSNENDNNGFDAVFGGVGGAYDDDIIFDNDWRWPQQVKVIIMMMMTTTVVNVNLNSGACDKNYKYVYETQSV